MLVHKVGNAGVVGAVGIPFAFEAQQKGAFGFIGQPGACFEYGQGKLLALSQLPAGGRLQAGPGEAAHHGFVTILLVQQVVAYAPANAFGIYIVYNYGHAFRS